MGPLPGPLRTCPARLGTASINTPAPPLVSHPFSAANHQGSSAPFPKDKQKPANAHALPSHHHTHTATPTSATHTETERETEEDIAMGRAPCCEKMGLKKGPWTPEEDKRFGHGNWRALPKQAGEQPTRDLLPLTPASFSGYCRLRWINYLRPDIKRGNFSKEEEDAIIRLHEELGNRPTRKENPKCFNPRVTDDARRDLPEIPSPSSALADDKQLPGRTDNEIKNVWHTHLKKRLVDQTKHDKPSPATKRRRRAAPVSPERSAASSSVTESSVTETTEQGNTGSSSPRLIPKEESFTSSPDAEEFQFDESFWSETLSMPLESFDDVPMEPTDAFGVPATSSAAGAEDMDYWLKVFMESGDVQQELPQI
ncbi:hypothetical protein HU200_032543 [Digitaria exilis]|uniref:Uncharacterized protein n=1 Tax=Digitaria exilis TaxID=1010633 RepID=A0A835BJI8_9POAL|nr:hypothetical protein HU200_032543 [Digitaria exilis]